MSDDNQAAESRKIPPRVFPEITELTDKQQTSVNKFFSTVWEPYSKGEKLPGDEKTYTWPGIYQRLSDDEARVWCYKLMIARKFDIDEAKKMLQTILEFRVEFNTERAYFPPPFPVKGWNMDELVKFSNPNGKPRPQNEDVDRTAKFTDVWQSICFHKTTKWGHPVSYECWGLQHPQLVPLSLKRLANVAKGEKYLDVHLRYHVNMAETGIRLARYQDHTFGKQNNEKVTGILCVCDMRGLGMHQFASEFVSYLSQLGEFDKKVYPEFLHHVLVINCPTIIRAAFAVVSPLIDARTQTKISFHAPGEASIKALRQWIHDDDIPSIFDGGKCKCEGGCINVPNYEAEEKEYAAIMKQVKNGGAAAAGGATQAGDSELADVGVEVGAGKSLARELIVKKDDAVSWEWLADEERTVEFSVQFQGDEPGSPIHYVVKPDKVTKHSGSHTAPIDGKVRIVFGNEFSWMRSKYLNVKTGVTSKSATCDGDDGAGFPLPSAATPGAVVSSIHIDGEERNLNKKEVKGESERQDEKQEVEN